MESIEDLKATAYRKITEAKNRRKYFNLKETWVSEDGEAYHRRKAIDNDIPAPTKGGMLRSIQPALVCDVGVQEVLAAGRGKGQHMARQQVCGGGRRAVNKRY